MDDLVESTLTTSRVFEGRLLKVNSDTVRLPNGRASVREYVEHPGAVMTLALLDSGKLLFERQYRYPLRRVFLELPAGKIDPGEDVLQTARRELQEETGYTARDWRHVGVIHPCIGYSNERIEICLARELTHVGHAFDDGEILEVLELDLDQAIAAVLDGRITDAKTVAGLFWAERLLRGQ